MPTPFVPPPCGSFRLRPISVLRFWISGVWLKQNLHVKGWNSQVHREFPGSFESTKLSRDNRSREIGRSFRLPCALGAPGRPRWIHAGLGAEAAAGLRVGAQIDRYRYRCRHRYRCIRLEQRIHVYIYTHTYTFRCL